MWMLIPHLSQAERDHIDRCGLTSLLDMSRHLINHGLLTALAEHWHSKHNTFHLSTDEMTITPEDVYRILCIPVMGELVYYDLSEQGGTDALHKVFDDDEVGGYYIAWQKMLDIGYTTLPIVLVGFVGGFLCPNHRSKGLSIGWGHLLEQLIAWGT